MIHRNPAPPLSGQIVDAYSGTAGGGFTQVDPLGKTTASAVTVL
ncbi:MAG: hypothetical protein ACOYL3_01325 [Desulfuromonadaceae bacterium]